MSTEKSVDQRIADALERIADVLEKNAINTEQEDLGGHGKWETLDKLLIDVRGATSKRQRPYIQRIIHSCEYHELKFDTPKDLRMAFTSAEDLIMCARKKHSLLELRNVGPTTWNAFAHALEKIGFWDK